MSHRSRIIPTLMSVCATALIVGGALAQAAQMKAAGPQPGDCKNASSVAVGANPAMAQAVWVQIVSAQYGKNWANWVGARDKAILPLGAQSYQARAIPCFHYPVE